MAARPTTPPPACSADSGSRTRTMCPVVGCRRIVSLRGMCSRHAKRVAKHGDPHETTYEGGATHGALHFDEGRARKPIQWTVDTDGCWVCHSHSGAYPRVEIAGKAVKISRYFYEKFVEPIPDGGLILHSCDNTKCVNPEHLRVGTAHENIRDKSERHRSFRPQGSEAHLSKMTEADVVTIRNSDEATAVLAERLGVSTSAVGLARNGMTWRNVPMPSGRRPKRTACFVKYNTTTHERETVVLSVGTDYGRLLRMVSDWNSDERDPFVYWPITRSALAALENLKENDA